MSGIVLRADCVNSSSGKHKDLVPVTQTNLETTLCLAAAHALVLLDDGVVGDPMEKTTLDALGWKLSAGAPLVSFLVRRRPLTLLASTRRQDRSAR